MCISAPPKQMLAAGQLDTRQMASTHLQGTVGRAGPYLHTGLRQIGTHGQPLAHHHIWVMSLLEGLLQGLKLLGCECCATTTLFAVLGAIAGLQDDVLKCTAVGGQTEGAHLIMGNKF